MSKLPAGFVAKLSELDTEQLDQLRREVYNLSNAGAEKRQKEIAARRTKLKEVVAKSGICERMSVRDEFTVKVPTTIFFRFDEYSTKNGELVLDLFSAYFQDSAESIKHLLHQNLMRQNEKSIKKHLETMRALQKEIAKLAKDNDFDLGDVYDAIYEEVNVPNITP